jgi:hypothetical protein
MIPTLKFRAWAALLLLCAAACKPDPGPEPQPGDCADYLPPLPQGLPTAPSPRIWILNEGNFQWGNASLDWYEPASGRYYPSVFDSINGQPLGDVLQSLSFFEGKAWLVVNNSGKLEAVSPATCQRLGSIAGLTSPRFFVGISPDKAYVSDLYANAIAIVDPSAYAVKGSIPLPGWSEQMLRVGDEVFVANVRRSYLYVLDSRQDRAVDSIAVGPGGSRLGRDYQGLLWLACGGSLQDSVPGALYRIDPFRREVLRKIEFPAGRSPGEIALSPDGRLLYYLDEALYVMHCDSARLPACPLVATEGALYYGLGVDPRNGDLYLADAIDYVQRGVIEQRRPDGSLVRTFRGGIIPGRFAAE